MLQENQITFSVNGKDITWTIFHNLDERGLSLEAACVNWAARTTKFTPKSLCNYIMSKDPDYIIARTEEEQKTEKIGTGKPLRLERTDPAGNTLYKDQYKNNNYFLSLKLLKEKRTRRIGAVDAAEGVLYVQRSRNKHILQKNNSYGFNDIALQQPGLKEVIVTDEVASYRIPVSAFTEHGQYLFFKQTGFERQVFLPLSIIERYEI